MIDKKRVSFSTLGCRLNMSETGEIAQQFVDRGYEVVGFGEEADLTFLNTCTVTDGADSSCRNLIRKAQKFSPEAKIVVAGCYAQMESEKLREMKGIDLILGTNEKFKVFDYLEEADEEIIKIDLTNEFWGAKTTEADCHTRAFLKIQDGCNYICSYCVIPHARGRSRTRPIGEIVDEITSLLDQGFQEIVLTGVNIGEYEATSGESLTDLVHRVTQLKRQFRLRLSSVEVNTMKEELLLALKQSGIYQDHFHIPLQSGSDDILKSMLRKYDVDFYRQKIALIKDHYPQASIGADVIVGYPGETHEQFMETFQLLKEMPITHFHVFPFSKRQKTLAAKLPDQIQASVKKERVKTLISLGEEKLTEAARMHLGSTVEVLFEEKNGKFNEGHTPHYFKVKVSDSRNLKNLIYRVKLLRWEGEYFLGAI